MDNPGRHKKGVLIGASGFKWKPIYSKIVLFDHQNIPTDDIAKRLRVSSKQINDVRSSQEYRNRLTSITNRIESQAVKRIADAEVNYITKAKAILEKNTVRAAKMVVAFTKSGTSKDRIKLDAALQILDRCNIKGKEIIETTQRPLSPEELISAKSTLLELETITQRVSQTHSRFVLTKPTTSSETDQGSHDQSPIEAQSQSSPLDEAEPTGQDRSNPEPTQLILPV